MSKQRTVNEPKQETSTEGIVKVADRLHYITFWLDESDVKKIQALADLEEHDNFHTFLRYHVVKTGLEVLMSNTQDIGEKFVERLEGKKEDA
jgi:hypothetical protein